MRVGILALLQESNTFVEGSTRLNHFEEDLLVTGEALREKLAGTQHEIGGFFAGLAAAGIEAVPIFAARAYPFGIIEAATFDRLVGQMLSELSAAGELDGILAAPHGATVAENHPDADGWWLGQVRAAAGPEIPIIATIDPHANLSAAMVEATDALIAYRTNPHLDQRETGENAAALMARTLNGKIRPVQRAAFPPMAINIQSQQTAEPPLSQLYDHAAKLRTEREIVSDSIVLGFPYADVTEMGSATLVVTDGDPALAEVLAHELAVEMWEMREAFEPDFVGPAEAIADAADSSDRITLLDMGDNVGGGSPADGTILFERLHRYRVDASFVCLYDPESVEQCEDAGPGQTIELHIGGRSDLAHGDPVTATCRVTGFSDGKFSESKARHGGFAEFDMGRTAIVETGSGVTVMLTSRRVPPFSLEQLRSCGLDPLNFRVFVAKGVVAPMAAYRECCNRFIHVDTPGCTSADMKRLPFQNRRRPMFPFEPDAAWPAHPGESDNESDSTNAAGPV